MNRCGGGPPAWLDLTKYMNRMVNPPFRAFGGGLEPFWPPHE
jgi:hypothetical protein